MKPKEVYKKELKKIIKKLLKKYYKFIKLFIKKEYWLLIYKLEYEAEILLKKGAKIL